MSEETREDIPVPESDLHFQVNRTPGGRFVPGQSGNPSGKPPGCRNHASGIAEALLDDDVEALTRTAVARALDGNAAALRLCFDRLIAPRRARPVQLDLPPMATPADVAAAMAAVTVAVAGGVITPGEGAEVAKVVDTYVRAIEASDFDRRLKALEAVYAADARTAADAGCEGKGAARSDGGPPARAAQGARRDPAGFYAKDLAWRSSSATRPRGSSPAPRITPSCAAWMR